MAQDDIAVIILAAGQGTRMLSDQPKVLHRLAGVPLIVHAMAAARRLDPVRVILVTGHGAAAVTGAAEAFDPEVETVVQAEQLGTGHAVAQALPLLEDFDGRILIIYGDTPFISAETLTALAEHPDALAVLGFEASEPGRYGRLVTGPRGLERIVEWKDADAATRAITLCNSGVMAADARLLHRLTSRIGNDNAAGEYYLTDLVALAREAGRQVAVVSCPEEETLGINTRAELAAAEAAFQARTRAAMLAAGVTLTDPGSVRFAFDTAIGRDAVIGPFVVFGPGVTIETGAEIRAFCHLEGCHVSSGALVGPYARLRPGAELDAGVHVGNFVEVKNTQLRAGAKANHLTYLGDAEIGEGANIGAGTITCNYDGVSKHRTRIGARAFIGSDTMLVAPVSVGADAMTASGSVITEDIPAGALGLGRARQVNKPGLATRIMDALRGRQKGSN